MKSIFASVISKGDYDLAAMLQRIDTYHVEGKLTDAERDELYALARQAPEKHYNCEAEIERLWAAVRALQSPQNGDDAAPDTTDDWPAYVQPTGAHDAYQTGAQVVYNGQKYRCIMDNCVWAPDVYPAAWEVVTDE